MVKKHAQTTKGNEMTESPINDHIKSYMEPLIKSSERIGSARALLMVAQWIKDEIDADRLKHTIEVKRILDGMETIRTDILLNKANRG
jgi:hypothetical protein